MAWTEVELSTYQHHAISHVMGATVLGWFIAGDAAHLLLDIGLLWTIYVNAAMDLMAQAVAIPDLESDELSKNKLAEVAEEAQTLLSDGRDAEALKYFSIAPLTCLITSVELFGDRSQRLIIIRGEEATIKIETSIDTSELTVSAQADNIREES